MAAIEYLKTENLVNKLSNLQHQRPGYCSGFRFLHPESLLVNIPQPSIHFDEVQGNAITVLCSHGSNGMASHCQVFAEILFPLITAFARRPMSLDTWLDLFPSIGNNDFADPAHPFCVGLMRAYSDKQTNPPRVRAGIEINEESSLVPTVKCTHTPCEPELPYIMAALRAFSLGLLKNVGYEPNGIDKRDILYVTEGFCWARAFAEAEPTPYGDVLCLRDNWPQTIYREIQGCLIWSPGNLILEDSIDKENSIMSPPRPSFKFVPPPVRTPQQQTAFIYPQCFQESHKAAYGPFRSSPYGGSSLSRTLQSSFPSKPYARGSGSFPDTALKMKILSGDPADISNVTMSSRDWSPPGSTSNYQMININRTSSTGYSMWCNFSLMRDGLRVMSFICDEMLKIANESQKVDLRNVIFNNYKKCGE